MPHRTQLLELIADYRLRYPLEIETTGHLERFVRENSGLFFTRTASRSRNRVCLDH